MQAVRGDNIASHCHDPLFGERRLSSYEKVLEIRQLFADQLFSRIMILLLR